MKHLFALLLLLPLTAFAQSPDCDDTTWNGGQVSIRDIGDRLGILQCVDDPPPPDECADAIDNDGDGYTDGADPGCTDGTEAPFDPPPVTGGALSFTRIDTPGHGVGQEHFGIYIWDGQVGMSDHITSGGNDPVWLFNTSSFTYVGQLSQPASVRTGRMITLPTGRYPVSGRGVFGSGNPDRLHINGETHYLCDPKWGSEECQGWGDVNGDGVDDILKSNGVVWDGATLVTGPNEASPTAVTIGTGISLWRNSWYSKAACLWQDRVLTDAGLQDLQGNLLATIPAGGSSIKGGFGCGDFDGDGDQDVTYSSGGPDSTPGGTTYLLRNDGDAFTQMPLGGLPVAGGIQRRYTIPVAEDLNNDGCDDLVLADHGIIYQSECDMTFTVAETFPVSGARMPSAVAGDLNNDAFLDVCVTPDENENYAICYINDGGSAPAGGGGTPDPKATGRVTDSAALEQFAGWYAAAFYDDLNTWMYDRVGTLYELWERTGDEAVRNEARRSAIEYVKHYQVDGSGNGGWPNCDGGWSHANVNKCDSKMTYLSPLYYLNKHEGISFDPALVATLGEYQWRMGWGVGWTSNPWSKITERDMGYSLMGIQYACRMGHDLSCSRIPGIVGHLDDLQVDGWFLHSYHGHEKTADPTSAGDALVASPWMSAILIDALVRANEVAPDPRIAGIVAEHAQAQLDALQFDILTHHPYNGTDYLPWYLYFPSDAERTFSVQQNDGWYSDQHLPEVTRTIEAGGLTVPYDITNFYTREMIEQVTSPVRLFAWQH